MSRCAALGLCRRSGLWEPQLASGSTESVTDHVQNMPLRVVKAAIFFHSVKSASAHLSITCPPKFHYDVLLYLIQIGFYYSCCYFIGGRKIYKCCGQFFPLKQEFPICHHACIYMCKDCSTTETLCLSIYPLYLHDPDNDDGVITHLRPDILECEVRWALESIIMNKAREVIEYQLSYFKS